MTNMSHKAPANKGLGRRERARPQAWKLPELQHNIPVTSKNCLNRNRAKGVSHLCLTQDDRTVGELEAHQLGVFLLGLLWEGGEGERLTIKEPFRLSVRNSRDTYT